MKTHPMGNTGLLLSELALGTMIFGEEGQRGTSKKDAVDLIHRYLDRGGNHIDTANVYAGGRSEEIVGEALRGKRSQVVLATKVRFAVGDGPNDQGLSRYHILRSVEDSLRRLNTETIDLLYMHAWDPLTPLEESLRAFDHLVRAGKVRYIGVSNFKAWQLMKSLCISDGHDWVRFQAAQYQYSLVEREIEAEIGDLCQVEELSLIPWGPLGGGFLSGKYQRGDRPESGRLAVMPEKAEEAWQRRALEGNWRILDVMDDIKSSYNYSHPQIALRWLLEQPGVDSVILGVRTAEQLEDNLGAAEIHLPEEEISRLNEISAPQPGYPHRFLEAYARR